MMQADREILFTSLGFLALVLNDQTQDENAAIKAQALGNLIEAFCRDQHPDAFSATEEKAPIRVVWLLNQIIASLKKQMKAEQTIELPSDRDLKFELLQNLQNRQSLYVMDAQKSAQLLDVAIEHLLKAEIKNVESEAQMMVTHLQGDPNAFAPYQQLATTIANIIRKKGRCTKDDVKGKGFTNEELEDWNMAYALAHVDLMGG